MARYQHSVTGVIVSCDDELVLGPEWQPIDAEPAPKRAKSAKADTN